MNNESNIFNQPIDQGALNLTRAIALQESGNGTMTPNYKAVGDNGTSSGAYQWQPGNFENDAKAAGLDPTDFSPENQDKVAYAAVKSMKDEGRTPEQIAATWNAGSTIAMNGSWKTNVGTRIINGKPVHFDTPAYVNGVNSYYNRLASMSSNSGVQPTQQTEPQPSPQDDSLGTELGNRLKNLSGNISDLAAGIGGQGKQNPLSDVLQAGGEIAGGVGDIINKGLELIPGVKWLEGKIGEGVNNLAQTPVGQQVVGSLISWAKEHPELAKDVGAGFNIATAIPIFRGLGAVKDIALSGIGKTLEGIAEKGALDDMSTAFSRTKTLSKVFERNGGSDTLKEAIAQRLIPEIENGKYSTETAFQQAGENISNIEDNELAPRLKQASTNQISQKVPLEDLRQEALSTVKSEFKSSGNTQKALNEVNRVFDDYKNSYGDYVSLEDMNDMKRGIRTSVNFNSPKLESDVTYHIGQTFQKGIEDNAFKMGITDIKAINQKMAVLLKYQNMLKSLDRTPVGTSLLRRTLQHTAGITAGGFIGRIGGIPGELGGMYVGNAARGIFDKTAIRGSRILEATNPGMFGEALKTGSKKIAKGIFSSALQKEGRQ